MTLRSYAIAVVILGALSVSVVIGSVWTVGGSTEHFAGQDGDE